MSTIARFLFEGWKYERNEKFIDSPLRTTAFWGTTAILAITTWVTVRGLIAHWHALGYLHYFFGIIAVFFLLSFVRMLYIRWRVKQTLAAGDQTNAIRLLVNSWLYMTGQALYSLCCCL